MLTYHLPIVSLLTIIRITTLSSKPQNVHPSISKHGRRACSNTTNASHTLPPQCHRATSARGYRTRTLPQGGDPPTSDIKNRHREEVQLMSETMGKRLHGQHTRCEHRAASATTASRTASRVRADKCLSPCDLRHQHRMVQIRDRNREGRLSTVDCRRHQGGCTATCSSCICVPFDDLSTPSFAHV